ncbi:MAG: phosphohistidine phosphatase SixA [Thermoleophilia bacterium]|nr:phosphohistidine phosphatase SixA [Thermoleophilia bacterium]
MRVYLVRHAEAAPGEPDELRELTPAGQETARALGTQLAANGVRPAALLTSPLLRARQTAGELARSLGVEAEPDERLAPGATPKGLREAVAGRGETVIAVAHQPDCGLIVAALTGGEPPRFPPGGVVAVEVPG